MVLAWRLEEIIGSIFIIRMSHLMQKRKNTGVIDGPRKLRNMKQSPNEDF